LDHSIFKNRLGAMEVYGEGDEGRRKQQEYAETNQGGNANPSRPAPPGGHGGGLGWVGHWALSITKRTRLYSALASLVRSGDQDLRWIEFGRQKRR
jgi:hypothetical protein